MKIKYEITKNSVDQTVILRTNLDGSVSSFMADENNSDYQQYLASLNDTNEL
jgi:hypothetical protein